MSEDDLTPLSAEAIAHVLRGRATGPLGATVHYAAQASSTNDLAKQLAADGAPEGTLVIADEQTAGRGRMGRRWAAPPNTSLLMSLIFRPTLPPEEAGRLVMACGLAAAEAIETLTGLKVDAKWPNDLQIGGAKVAGVLAESEWVVGADQLDFVIVGMGINVNMRHDPAHDLIAPATSLLRETGQPQDRLALLGSLLERLHHWQSLLADSQLDEAWQARLLTLGQSVTVGDVRGVAERVDRTGALWVREESGEVVRLTAGETSP